MTYDFKLTTVINATPQMIYDAWLDSRAHSAMTGAKARQSPKLGAPASAWGGYISGKNLELKRGKRIVQSWRTTQFSDDDPDSTITVELAPVKAGTRLTLKHTGVPDGQTSYENGGWQDNYFKPMQAYFAEKPRASAAKAPKRAAGKKKAAATKAAKRSKTRRRPRAG